jgi:hypothetical protein
MGSILPSGSSQPRKGKSEGFCNFRGMGKFMPLRFPRARVGRYGVERRGVGRRAHLDYVGQTAGWVKR